MCLSVSDQMTKRYQNKSGLIKAYKICELRPSRFSEVFILYSPYQETKILLNDDCIFETESSLSAESSRGYSWGWGLDGISKKECYQGIHAFLSEKEAKQTSNQFIKGSVRIFTVWIDPKDVVGVGEFETRPSICSRSIRFDERHFWKERAKKHLNSIGNLIYRYYIKVSNKGDRKCVS